MRSDKRQQAVRTVWWEEDTQGAAVCRVDQSLLPQNVFYLRLRDEQQVADAITTLKVRGAPAIGVTAAFGMALALYRLLQERSRAVKIKNRSILFFLSISHFISNYSNKLFFPCKFSLTVAVSIKRFIAKAFNTFLMC